MNEAVKKFAEFASQNEEVKAQLDALSGETDKDVITEKVLEIAKNAGFSLTADDLAQSPSESDALSDDELDAVAGGTCFCAFGGGGKGRKGACIIIGYYKGTTEGGKEMSGTCILTGCSV